MGFWDTFGKVASVGVASAAVVGATASGVSKIMKSRHQRKLEERKMEIEERKQSQDERSDLLAQEIRLKELELQQRKMDSSNYVDLAKTQMNTQADLQKTQMSTQADVQKTSMTSTADMAKAKYMYADGGINGNAMFYDKESGILVDNRNVSVGVVQNPGLMNYNYAQAASMSNMSMSEVQRKILDANNLLKQGLITQEEFSRIKMEILRENF